MRWGEVARGDGQVMEGLDQEKGIQPWDSGGQLTQGQAERPGPGLAT